MKTSAIQQIVLRYLSSLHGTQVEDERVYLKSMNQTAIIHMCGDHIVINLENTLPSLEHGTIALPVKNLGESMNCVQNLYEQIHPMDY